MSEHLVLTYGDTNAPLTFLNYDGRTKPSNTVAIGVGAMFRTDEAINIPDDSHLVQRPRSLSIMIALIVLAMFAGKAAAQDGVSGPVTWFGGAFSQQSPQNLQAVELGIQLRVDQIATLLSGPLIYWALSSYMTNMAYPSGFPVPVVPGRDCTNTTTSWGHVGLQIFQDGSRKANWGGGGNGNGQGDYGCAGSDVSALPWNTGTWYGLVIRRYQQVTTNLWLWSGSVQGPDGLLMYWKTIYGGEYLNPTALATFSEPIGYLCSDPTSSVTWRNPYLKNIAGDWIPITHVIASYGDGPTVCQNSNQTPTGGQDLGNFAWTHEFGNAVARSAPNGTDLLPTGMATVAGPLYRIYDPIGQHHFYTTSLMEKQIVLSWGFEDEGAVGGTFFTQASAPTAAPLFRLNNPGTGDHLYTMNPAERQWAYQFGYVDEGAIGYAYSAQATPSGNPVPPVGTMPLYRIARSSVGDHFYTSDAHERDVVLQQPGNYYEGIAAYVLTMEMLSR